MMNLIWEYIIIIIILFGINMGLLLNATKYNSKKSITFSFIYAILIFIISLIALNFSSSLTFLSNYIEYILFIVGVLLFILIVQYLYIWNERKTKELEIKSLTFIGNIICSIILIFTLVALWEPQGSIFINAGLIAIIILVISLISLKFSKNIVGGVSGGISEYMILESILIIIFGLTFTYVRDLDYKSFTPFTMLTPTYQIVILIIGVIALFVIGIFINDSRLKK